MIAWSMPAPRMASSPPHLARNHTFAASGAAPDPDPYTNLPAPARTAAWTNRCVPRWSNSSNVYRFRGFSTGKVGNVRICTTTSAPATARSSEDATRRSPSVTRAPIDSILSMDRAGWAVITATSLPSRTSRLTTADPMNPLPPATRITAQLRPALGHQPAGEPFRVERHEVIGFLARADQFDRHPQLFPNGQDDAAPGRAVHLRQDQSGHADRGGERPGLGDAVLAGRGVEDQEHLVDPARRLLQDALHLGQLLHEWLAGVEAAGGVHDQHAVPPSPRGLYGVECHGPGIGSAFLGHEVRPRPGRPHLELLAGGRPERIARGQAHGPSLPLQEVGELADRRGLSRPIHPDHHHDARRTRRGGPGLVAVEYA